MSLFRRKLVEPELVRVAQESDGVNLGRLVHTADRRFLTSDSRDAVRLLHSDPTGVLEAGGRLVGALTFGWRAPPVAWLRMALLQGSTPTFVGLRDLCAVLYPQLRDEGIRLAAITLDEWSAPWLRKPLSQLGYRPMVEVVGYEKLRLDRPAAGNQVVGIRRARPDDLPAVLALDRACFPLPWVKGAEIFNPALTMSPCFAIAEFGGSSIGYAFVTSHYSGRLVHLVRIAVAPDYQGRGVGTRLLAEIVDFCSAAKAEVLTLNTQADNYQAQRLYEWFGFTRNGEQQTVLGVDITGDPPSTA